MHRRRSAAIALAHRGDAGARDTLLRELERSPSEAPVDALAAIADEDAMVHLGRCAVDQAAPSGPRDAGPVGFRCLPAGLV